MLNQIRRIIKHFKNFTATERAAQSGAEVLPEKLNIEWKEPESYAAKREAAKAYLGKKWILHPSNHVQRQEVEPFVLQKGRDNAGS